MKLYKAELYALWAFKLRLIIVGTVLKQEKLIGGHPLRRLLSISAEALQRLHMVHPSAATYHMMDASPTRAVFFVTLGFSVFFSVFMFFSSFFNSDFLFSSFRWVFFLWFSSVFVRQEHVCVVLSRRAQVSVSAPQRAQVCFAQEHSCASLGSTI